MTSAATIPPPTETLGKSVLTGLIAARVATRRPTPAEQETVPSGGFLRIESGGGSPVDEQVYPPLEWDIDLILHGYHDEEDQAEQLSTDATGIAGGLLGLSAEIAGRTWYLNFASVASLPIRQTDPMVNLVRYRSMVTWRVLGNPI